MLNETWNEQYDRMLRSFALLKQIGERRAQPQDVISARDVVYHFCCDAFHLRDWIAATLGIDEATMKIIARQIDTDVIVPSPELSACCDIANGFKHLTLHRRSYVTRTNQGYAELVSHGVTIGVPPMRLYVGTSANATVTHSDETTDADPAPEPQLPTAPDPSGDEGWVQDTFKIDINASNTTLEMSLRKRWRRGISGFKEAARSFPNCRNRESALPYDPRPCRCSSSPRRRSKSTTRNASAANRSASA